MSLGKCSNTFTKLLALWGLLWFVKRRGFMVIRIVGDSKVIVDWANGQSSIQSLLLHDWK